MQRPSHHSQTQTQYRQHPNSGQFVFVMAFVFVLGCLVVLLSGCAGGKKPTTAAPAVLPPKPTGLAVKQDISGARDDTKAAQVNVKIGKAEAEKAGVTAASLPLADADTQLSQALQKLDDATAHNGELDAALKARDGAQSAALAALQQQLDTATETITDQEDKISQLENEALRRTKLIVGGAGATLLLGAAVSVAAFFFLGFVAGLRVGMVCFVVGSIAVTLAAFLTQIVFWTAIALGVAVLAAVAYGLWKVFHHTPTKTIGVKTLATVNA